MESDLEKCALPKKESRCSRAPPFSLSERAYLHGGERVVAVLLMVHCESGCGVGDSGEGEGEGRLATRAVGENQGETESALSPKAFDLLPQWCLQSTSMIL